MLRDLSPLIKTPETIDLRGNSIPLQYSISLLKNVDAACEEFRSKEKHLDLLVMCPEYLKLSWIGTNDSAGISHSGNKHFLTSEVDHPSQKTKRTLQTPISLRYYVRMRFIHNLFPLLPPAPTSRILSIHGAGKEGHLIESDLELRKNFSMRNRNASMHTAAMNTLALQEIAATHPTVSCVHVFPGVVVTKGMVTTSLDDSAQRHLFHATSPRYPPADEEEQDLPLPEGIQVTEGADGKKGSGCYLLGRREK
ncbi:MAG: hypothetical protein LQ343_000784 [Gyalolechia ehrenbergii]|nr:MAG: hypothetical protein LQ343_000784 [Gyalolechia ehrenbergii]